MEHDITQIIDDTNDCNDLAAVLVKSWQHLCATNKIPASLWFDKLTAMVSELLLSQKRGRDPDYTRIFEK